MGLLQYRMVDENQLDKIGRFLHEVLSFKDGSRHLATQLGWPEAISIYQANFWVRDFARINNFFDGPIIKLPHCSHSELLGTRILHQTEVKSRILPHLVPPQDPALLQVYDDLDAAYHRTSWYQPRPFGQGQRGYGPGDQGMYRWDEELCMTLGITQISTMYTVAMALRRYVLYNRDKVLTHNRTLAELHGSPLGRLLGVNYLSTRDVYLTLSHKRDCIYSLGMGGFRFP